MVGTDRFRATRYITYFQMLNTEVTVISLVDFPHMVTERTEAAERRKLLTQPATVLKEVLIGMLDLLGAEADLVLTLEQFVSEHLVAELLIRMDGIREHHLCTYS